MKLRKGFTLIEVVVTLSIIGISTALTVVVAANLANIQSASAIQYSYAKQINDINDIANKYVSFVSLDTTSASFSYVSSTNTSITFSASGTDLDKAYHYTFKFDNTNNSFEVTNDNNYSGDNSYFIYSASVKTKDITSDKVNFSYNEGTLTLTINLNGMDNHLVYVVRSKT